MVRCPSKRAGALETTVLARHGAWEGRKWRLQYARMSAAARVASRANRAQCGSDVGTAFKYRDEHYAIHWLCSYSDR